MSGAVPLVTLHLPFLARSWSSTPLESHFSQVHSRTLLFQVPLMATPCQPRQVPFLRSHGRVAQGEFNSPPPYLRPEPSAQPSRTEQRTEMSVRMEVVAIHGSPEYTAQRQRKYFQTPNKIKYNAQR